MIKPNEEKIHVDVCKVHGMAVIKKEGRGGGNGISENFPSKGIS